MALLIQITWFDNGQYRITDAHDKLHDQISKFMLEHFYSHQVFRVLKIPQEPAIEEEFLKLVKHILKDESSLVVLDNENCIKGVALLKCMSREWRSWTALQLLIESEGFKELCAMVFWCMQQQLLKHKDNPVNDSLHIFSYHLCQDLQGDNEFLDKFFKTICDVARHMHMPKVTYMSLSQTDGEIIKTTGGFKEIIRVIYSIYVFKGRRPFDRLRDINEMYGVFYEHKVEPLRPYQEMLIRHEEAKELTKVPKKLKEE